MPLSEEDRKEIQTIIRTELRKIIPDIFSEVRLSRDFNQLQQMTPNSLLKNLEEKAREKCLPQS